MSGVVRVLVPGGVADPGRASGGNTYDRRLCDTLRASGWSLLAHEVDGGWPWDPEHGRAGLAAALAGVPDGQVVLVDGLLASRLPQVVVPEAARVRMVLLVHLPVGVDDVAARWSERRVVAAATSVVTTSAWTRDWLVGEYGLAPHRVAVARPGVDAAARSPGSGDGASLLVVGNLSPVKGHDQLLAALADLRDLGWRCRWIGSTTVAPSFVSRLRDAAAGLGIDDRLELTGTLTGARLDAAYADGDLLVLPSRRETYAMVVTEALARGLPVVATAVGGVAEALDGAAPADAARAGVLVEPDDPAALADALRSWLTDPGLRSRLRAAAESRRARLGGWPETAARVGAVLREAAA